MTEGLPDAATGVKGRVRARMWADALAAHRSGRIRAVEVRGSDYLGYGVGQGGHIPRLVPRALRGKGVRVFGSPDQPHSWTDVADMARALTAAARSEQAWGRVWHAPSNPPRTQREAITDICRSAGTEPGPIRAYGGATLRAGSWVSATLRELEETRYQFDRPFLLDSSLIERELGIAPTPWADVCRRTAGIVVPAAGSPTVS
jgi:nucleoside-diphosphate-sugar epimerase